jgi:IS5 family transposase
MAREGISAGWQGDLERWLAPFLERLGHKARPRMCPLYVAGLIGPGDRKSIQPMAERLGLGSHDRLHHFVSAGTWDAAPLLEELARKADGLLGGEDAVLVVDDTALPKKGNASVGVEPQYASALGKQANWTPPETSGVGVLSVIRFAVGTSRRGADVGKSGWVLGCAGSAAGALCAGHPLEKLAATVDFEIFRAELSAALGARDRAKGGRPACDPVLKFRMLVLQAMHGLSLAQTEYLVADRLNWMRFCGLGPGGAVPDANTLWDFREALIAAGALEALFTRLDHAITVAGYLPMAGQIVDATLVAAPRQRNTEAEKARIKAGEKAAAIWPDKPAKACQKDTDARWTVKFSKAKPAADGKPQLDIAIPTFGYKSHISVDRRHGVIRRGKTTDAAAHDRHGCARV